MWLKIENSIFTINHYEDIIKTPNKKSIGYLAKQGQISKKFIDTEDFFQRVLQSKYNVYSRIGVLKH